jgi:hypothetical protein
MSSTHSKIFVKKMALIHPTKKNWKKTNTAGQLNILLGDEFST